MSVNRVVVGRVRMPEDPADARGVLSHHHGVEPGSYGFLTELPVDLAVLEAPPTARRPIMIRFEVSGDAIHPRGFGLYGDRLGRWPVEPTLLLLTR